MEWKNIESAPKDGSVIMLKNNSGAWVGYYNPVYQSGFVPKNPWQSLMLNHAYMDHGPAFSFIPDQWAEMPI